MADCDLKFQIINKIAKRAYKLQTNDFQISPCFNSLRENIFKECIETTGKIKKSIESTYAKFRESSQLNYDAKIDFSKLKSSHIEHNNKSLQQKINELSSILKPNLENKSILPTFTNRPLTETSLPDIKQLKRNNFQMDFYDIENWIKSNLALSRIESKIRSNSQFLFDLLLSYQENASSFYSNDPVGYSRMAMASLNLGFKF